MSGARRPKGTGGIRNYGTARTPRWRAYHYIRVDGKRVQVSEGPFPRKADAEEWLNAQLQAKAAGRSIVPSRMTVAEMLDDWLAMTQHGMAENTFVEHRRRVETRLKPSLGERRLVDLRPAEVSTMLQELRKPGSNLRDPSRRISETSIQHIYSTLNTAMQWAVRQRLVATNVVADVDRPQRDATEMLVWSAGELSRFLESISGERLFPLIHLAAFTGMRRSELIGLRWPSLSLTDASLAVSRRRFRGDNGAMVEEERTKSRRGRRVVDLDGGTVSILRKWRKDQKAERLAWGPGYAAGDHVFTTEDGRPLHGDQVYKIFDRLRRESSLRPIRFHDLRHTHASLLLARNVPVVDVAHRLGDTPETILSTYAHFIPGQGRVAANAFADLIGQRW